MPTPITDDLKQKILGIYRRFAATVRSIRHEERTDVEQTVETIDQKHSEQIKSQIQQL